MDLLDVLGHAGRIRRALEERRLDLGPLDSPLDVVDEVRRDHVGVAVLEVVRQEVVGVDAGAGHDAHAGLIGDLLHEANVTPAEHRGRVDDRLDAVSLRGVDGLQRGVQLGLLVVAPGPVLGHRLVAETDVLVDQGHAELARFEPCR